MEDIMGESNSGALIRRIQTHLTIDLHPSKLASVSKGVHEQLNGLLLKYNDNLNGVVLSYSNEKVVSQTALVHPYFPLARLVVSATLVVFRPYSGARLIGIVNKLSDDFIGVVVLGFVNVVIKAPEIRSDLKRPVFGSSSWVSTKNPSHEIRVGDSIAFRVVEVKHEGTYVTLTGSLREKDTGNVLIVGLTGAEGAVVEATTKKDKGEKSSKKKVSKRKKLEDREDDDPSEVKKGKGDDKIGGNKVGSGVAGNAEAVCEQTAGCDKKEEIKKKRRREKDSSTVALEGDNNVKHNAEDGDLKVSKEKNKKEKKRKKGQDG